PFPRFDEVRRWLGGEAPQATAGGPVSGRPPNRARAPVLPPPQVSTPLPPRTSSEVAPVPEPPAVPEPERGSPALRLRVERRKNATVPDVAPSNARGVPDTRPNLLKDDLAIYRRAHQLHFHGGAPASALRAWDAYLIAYPAGTFAPEARFNRAVCLLRLGRRAEAKAILEPIAESSFAYGRERARALLGAME
ncbi:MAG TPA: hypothetical protein VFZ53_17750, partial [Polyangiaceae bacterium]